MKKFLLVTAIAMSAWETSYAANLSQYQVAGSGHYAQVVLGNAAIVPISIKLKDITFAGQDNCGLTVNISGQVAQISGQPTGDACVLLLRGRSPVDDAAVDLPVEIYKLDSPPVRDSAEWNAILATLPQLPPHQLNEVFITDSLDTIHAEFNMDDFFTKTYDLHVPNTNDGKPLLNDVQTEKSQLDTWTPKPYRSCAFGEVFRTNGVDNDDLYATITLKRDQLGSDVIEHCKLSAFATWDGDGDVADMINIYVVKSYN